MRTALAILLLSAAPALAGECYTSVSDPTSTVVMNGAAGDPNVVWTRDGKTVEMTLYGTGTGISTMMAVENTENPPDGVSVDVDADGVTLLFDKQRYEPGCK